MRSLPAVASVLACASVLSGCVVAPPYAEYPPAYPVAPRVVVQPGPIYGAPAYAVPGPIYGAPAYAVPGPGYGWAAHPRYGWGWRHPHQGWHRGWR